MVWRERERGKKRGKEEGKGKRETKSITSSHKSLPLLVHQLTSVLENDKYRTGDKAQYDLLVDCKTNLWLLSELMAIRKK